MYGDNCCEGNDVGLAYGRRRDCGCAGGSDFAPLHRAQSGYSAEDQAPAPKERKAWLEFIKARLEGCLEEINAEIQKLNPEQTSTKA